MFESEHRLYEIIVSACNEEEEAQWRKHLQERIKTETNEFAEGRASVQDHVTFSSLEIKAIGTVFGHPDSFVRRISVHRAATLGPKHELRQVIIKNTQAQKTVEPRQSSASLPITRSQSHLSAKHIPTLAPRRADRVRLEHAIAEVWTKDILPYPAMAHKRPENSIRASANSVMRKLSMASIASNFSRKSNNTVSLNRTISDESFTLRRSAHAANRRKSSLPSCKRVGPKVVDFHNAPQASSPADFELYDSGSMKRGRRAGGRAVHTENGNLRLRRMSRPSSFMARARPLSELPGEADVPKLVCSISLQGAPLAPEDAESRGEHESRARETDTPSPSRTESFTKRLAKQRSRLFKFLV